MKKQWLSVVVSVASLALVTASGWAIDIETLEDLQDMRNNLSGDYVLLNDIDASATTNWNKLVAAGA